LSSFANSNEVEIMKLIQGSVPQRLSYLVAEGSYDKI